MAHSEHAMHAGQPATIMAFRQKRKSKAAERAKRYRQKQEEQGRKQVNVILSPHGRTVVKKIAAAEREGLDIATALVDFIPHPEPEVVEVEKIVPDLDLATAYDEIETEIEQLIAEQNENLDAIRKLEAQLRSATTAHDRDRVQIEGLQGSVTQLRRDLTKTQKAKEWADVHSRRKVMLLEGESKIIKTIRAGGIRSFAIRLLAGR